MRVGEYYKHPTFEHCMLCLILILVGSAGFGLGKLSSVEKASAPSYTKSFTAQKAAVIESQPTKTVRTVAEKNLQASTSPSSQPIVASKNGTRYYFLNCSGAKRIKEENKIYFTTVDEATKAGYTLATNCSSQ